MAIKFLREVQRWPSPRDKAVALVPFYAGARISEVVGLDVDDVRLSARKGTLRIYGKGQKVREVPLHPPLRAALSEWLGERPDWSGCIGPALFLNQNGGRLSATSAHTIITTIIDSAGIEEKATAHTLRHTFATSLVRAGTDLVTVNPVVFAGFVISNSETGHGSFSIIPQITIQVCDNGMTFTRDAMREVHLGGRLQDGVIRWSSDT